MDIIVRNATHLKGKSYDYSLIKIKNKIFKFVYESYNANEMFNVSLFDGTQWNIISNIWDLGVVPEYNSYNIWDDIKRKVRADDLIVKANRLCFNILTNNE